MYSQPITAQVVIVCNMAKKEEDNEVWKANVQVSFFPLLHTRQAVLFTDYLDTASLTHLTPI